MDKSKQPSIRLIKQNDPKFTMEENYMLYPRAAFEISQHCPDNYRSIIGECMIHGWIKPVAYVRDSELFWEEFQK